MKTCFVIPPHTELGTLRDKMVLLPGVGNNVFSVGDSVSLCDRLVIDLTLDWFWPLRNPSEIFSLFADMYRYFALPEVEKVVFRGYYVETNDPTFQKTQTIFDGILGLMKKMFVLKEVMLPLIISRRGLVGSKHPLLQCLASMRAGVSERIEWSATSEVCVLYEMDFLSWLGGFLQKKEITCRVVGGEKYTLKEVVEKTEMIFSFSAITFDSHRWFRYRGESECSECSFSYGIENIAMELLY